MTRALPQIFNDRRGASMVEFALGLPLLALVGLGGLELVNYVLAYQKIERIATITADTIARNTLAPSERTFHDTFKAVDKLGGPFDIKNEGRTILTGVIGVQRNSAVVHKVVWQRCSGSLTAFNSAIGSEWTATADYGDGPDVTLPGGVVLQQNQMVVIGEVGYRYKPLININNIQNLPADGIIRQRSLFVTRGQAIPNVTPINGVIPARC